MHAPTLSLSGLALNYVVAQCEKDKVSLKGNSLWLDGTDLYAPTEDGRRAARILERERIDVAFNHGGLHDGQWTASAVSGANKHGHLMRVSCQGQTLLEAGLRCYVLRKKGKSVSIPALVMQRASE